MPERTCTVDGCDRKHIAQGFCTLHYRRWRKRGDPLYTPPQRVPATCSIARCDAPAIARGWCSSHYAAWRHHGDPTIRKYGVGVEPCIVSGCQQPGTGPMGFGWCETHYRRYQRHGSPFVTSRIVGDDVVRFETYLREGEPPAHAPELGPCWLWTGVLTPDGYASMGMQDLATDSAHRWSYRYHVGPLIEGLELDHLCRVRCCVNPWHLEQVTHLVNLERANAVRSAGRRKRRAA